MKPPIRLLFFLFFVVFSAGWLGNMWMVAQGKTFCLVFVLAYSYMLYDWSKVAKAYFNL